MADSIELYQKIRQMILNVPRPLTLGKVIRPKYIEGSGSGSDGSGSGSDSDKGSNDGDKGNGIATSTYMNVRELFNIFGEFAAGEYHVFTSNFNQYLEDAKIEVTKSRKQIAQLMFTPSLPENKRELLAMCKQSPFGDLETGTTVTDLSVRTAFECVPTLSPLFLEQILPALETDISNAMYLGRKIKLVFNKVNLYDVDGFFKPHVDTPVPGNIGSLVIGLNSDYRGGELKINDRKYLDADSADNVVAFYSDLLHEVNRVRRCFPITTHLTEQPRVKKCESVSDPNADSYRLTATFYIIDAQEDKPFSVVQTVPADILDKLNKYLQSSETIGFITRHKYSSSEIQSNSLRGIDLIVSQIFNQYFTLQCLPILIVHKETHPYDGKETCSETVYRFTEQDINSYVNDTDYLPLSHKNVNFVRVHPTSGLILHEDQEEMAEHTGNEARDGYYNSHYFKIGMIVSTKLS